MLLHLSRIPTYLDLTLLTYLTTLSYLTTNLASIGLIQAW